MSAQALIDLVHDHDRLRRDVVDLTWERDRLRRENAELCNRLREVNPVLIGNQPGTTMAMALARIVSSVAARHGITIQKLRRGGRANELVAVRHEAAWECRQVTPRPTFSAIAKAVGLSDHASAIHAVRSHARRLRLNPEPQTPAGTGGAPASPAHTLPVPAGLRREPGQVSAESGEGSPGGGAKTAR